MSRVFCGWWLAMLLAGAIAVNTATAQDRETKVRRDKEQLADNATWIYNDLDRALTEARSSGKPLFVVIRCIPCEACSKFDKQLLERENEVRDLLGQFVCVRIVQANGLDLSLFQFDYDQSFHAFFLNADKTIYGRFGTRSARPENEDMTMAGLRRAMLAVLDLHKNFPANRQQLAGKQARPAAVRVPEELAALKGKYTSKLDYEGKVVQSCIHCHQIRDAQRLDYRVANKPLPTEVLFPFPLPDVLGLRMNPDQSSTIAGVENGSAAARAGLQTGDVIESLAGQPLISTADLQWVLHNAPPRGELAAEVSRGNERVKITLPLDAGWRERCDISWRATTWDLRRMATGGLLLVDLPDDERGRRNLPPGAMALRVKHVGQYGDHAVGKRAGVMQDDIIVAAEGQSQRQTESQFIASALIKPRGESLALKILRGSDTLELKIPMQ